MRSSCCIAAVALLTSGCQEGIEANKPAQFAEPILAEGAPDFSQQKSELNLSAQYAQTQWPAGHRDGANTDYVPIELPTLNSVQKSVLEGHPVFWPPIAGPNGNVYVTTAAPPPASHLFALTPDGEVVWKAAPQAASGDWESLDSYAIINAPTVDAKGDIYVGDRNQLWAFHDDGRVKWVTDLTPHGVEWGLVTVVLTPLGFVGGISTDGKVLFFRTTDGQLAVPVIDLPGGAGPPAEDTPPKGLWQGLMDPAVLPFMFNLIQGWEMEVANTPAIHPETGRIYITGAGRAAGSGTLYGIDVSRAAATIAFEAPMGGGSGTSPVVSHDGKRVYAIDEEGRMVAADAHTGSRLWQTEKGGGGSASPSVSKDETIYTSFQDAMMAITPAGQTKWRVSFNELCASRLAPRGMLASLMFGEPVAFIDSIITVGNSTGWINVVCGHHLKLAPSRSQRTRVPVPRESLIVTFSLQDGSVVGEPLPIPETSEGFITPLPNGNVAVSSSGAITSIFYNRLNPVLTKRWKVAGPAKAGIVILNAGVDSAAEPAVH